MFTICLNRIFFRNDICLVATGGGAFFLCFGLFLSYCYVWRSCLVFWSRFGWGSWLFFVGLYRCAVSLRKHACSNILKILQPKTETFQIQNSDILQISAQKRLCVLIRGGSSDSPQSMCLSRNKKNNVYPCKPQFYYIKVEFKGIKIIKTCFRDDWCMLCSMIVALSGYLLYYLALFAMPLAIFQTFTIIYPFKPLMGPSDVGWPSDALAFLLDLFGKV